MVYIQADVKVGDKYGYKIGKDVIILDGDFFTTMDKIHESKQKVLDVAALEGDSIGDLFNPDGAILDISDSVWVGATQLQEKLDKIAAGGPSPIRQVDATVRIDSLLAFEAFPGVYVQEDGKIQLKEAAKRASLSFEDSTGTFEVTTGLLDRAEDLYRTLRRREELTVRDAAKNDR